MTIPKIEFDTIKTVSLSDVCRLISKFTGAPESRDRVWEYVRKSCHGNQFFCNDTYFIFHFPVPQDIEDWYLRTELGILEKMCEEAIDYDSFDTGMLVFEVCW